MREGRTCCDRTPCRAKPREGRTCCDRKSRRAKPREGRTCCDRTPHRGSAAIHCDRGAVPTVAEDCDPPVKTYQLPKPKRPARTCGRAVCYSRSAATLYARRRRSARPARPTSISIALVGSGTPIAFQLSAFFEFAAWEPNDTSVSSEASISLVTICDT